MRKQEKPDNVKKVNELPPVDEQVKFLYNVMRKRIKMMEYFIKVHFDNDISKDIVIKTKLDIEKIINNVEAASEIMSWIKKEKEEDYSAQDLNQLSLVSSFLGRGELPVFHHIANIYESLEEEEEKKN